MLLISINQPFLVQVIAMDKDFAYLVPSALVIMVTRGPPVTLLFATQLVPMVERVTFQIPAFVHLVSEVLIVPQVSAFILHMQTSIKSFHFLDNCVTNSTLPVTTTAATFNSANYPAGEYYDGTECGWFLEYAGADKIIR